MKKTTLAAVVAALVLLCSVSRTFAGGKDFVITFWCAPPTTETQFDERYAEVAKAGFNTVCPPCSEHTLEGNLKILDTCKKYGLKVIIGDNRLMAKEPNDPEFEKNIDAVIADYTKHPALYGYDLIDEPNAGLFPKIAAVKEYLKKKDPTHLAYVNLLPTYGNGAMWGTPTYTEHVERYMTTVKPDLLSYDHYALMKEGERGDYFENMEIIRSAALKYKTPWMNIILVSPHFGYRNPTEGELRWQVYTTLAYGGTGISYFTYWTLTGFHDFRNAIMETGGKATEHYEMVKKLNNEMKTLAPTLLKRDSTGFYHTAPVPNAAKALPEGTVVKSVEGAQLVIGFFEGPKKSQWMMLTNRDMKEAADATVMLASQMIIKEMDKTTGKLKSATYDAKQNPSVLKLKFEPGEGRLFSLSPRR
jgi:hypothetical protein